MRITARAQDQSFDVTLQREFGEGIAPITPAPQDVTRVLRVLCGARMAADGDHATFEPTLKVSRRDLDGAMEIRARDNGQRLVRLAFLTALTRSIAPKVVVTVSSSTARTKPSFERGAISRSTIIATTSEAGNR